MNKRKINFDQDEELSIKITNLISANLEPRFERGDHVPMPKVVMSLLNAIFNCYRTAPTGVVVRQVAMQVAAVMLRISDDIADEVDEEAEEKHLEELKNMITSNNEAAMNSDSPWSASKVIEEKVIEAHDE